MLVGHYKARAFENVYYYDPGTNDYPSRYRPCNIFVGNNAHIIAVDGKETPR